MSNNQFVIESIKIHYEFYKEILNNNRFFPKCRLIEYLDDIIISKVSHIEKDKIIYRARIYDDSRVAVTKEYQHKREIIDSLGFFGFSKENSSAPPVDKANPGRANPKFISYLYAAEDEYTAIAEVRPIIKSNISIATLKILDNLRIIDIQNTFNPFESTNLIDALSGLLSHEFSTPVDIKDEKSYLTTQFIAEYIKNKGYDGIKYNSSLSRSGKNIVLFDATKAEAISSILVEVNDIVYMSKSIRPSNDKYYLPVYIDEV